MEHYRISKLLNELTGSKFVRRKWIKVNGYQLGNIMLTKI